jgi:hypothetical protein
VTSCDLRWGRMSSIVRSPFSPAQPWAILFHPPDPPIALQSIPRDAPFSQVAMARRTVGRSIQWSFQARLSPPKGRWTGRLLRIAMDAGPYPAVALGDGETHCAKVRSDNVSDGPSLRSQAG